MMTTVQPSKRVRKIVRPPIAEVAEAARNREHHGYSVIRLSQAVPWYGPPDWAIEGVKERLSEPIIHRYSPDTGLDEVKSLAAERWFGPRGISLDPIDELHLTCGASQAFVGALTVAADPGQRVILTDPYYFDHLFAVHFLGLEPVFVPMIETDEGFSHDTERLHAVVGKGAAALVIVDPANPTASVLESEELKELATRCAASGCVLIVDETYERLVFDGRKREHPWTIPELRSCVLTVGSFSKSLGMAGWRLGYLFGDRLFMDEAYKVHDSVAICSPLPAQALLKEILEGPYQVWLDGKLSELHRRRQRCFQLLALGNSCFAWRRVEGGIFSLIAYESEQSSLEMAHRVLEEIGIVLVPGSAFGPAGERHLRLSFGSSTWDELTEALERFATFRP
jgi:aspartate/methionine/tyrosine aminotransferase